MPINYKKYPPNWKELREQVLERAGHKCEFCGVENYALGYRDKESIFHELTPMQAEAAALDGDKTIQIVLTIAHLDHDETNHNVSIDRLRALCQKCHLNYDVKEKQCRRKQKKALTDLFAEGTNAR